MGSVQLARLRHKNHGQTTSGQRLPRTHSCQEGSSRLGSGTRVEPCGLVLSRCSVAMVVRVSGVRTRTVGSPRPGEAPRLPDTRHLPSIYRTLHDDVGRVAWDYMAKYLLTCYDAVPVRRERMRP